ncbi:hypothetical protein V8E53_002203 [Lactarius tabidus]
MSFISVEPQSRVVLESLNNSLLAQFDTQLRMIADRYLAFFQERRSIEATFIASLRKLHRKAKTVDASFDPRAEPTTTRTAWDKVRDNLERDADAQQAFIDILANDVIKPLEILKESNDEIRNRMKDNLDGTEAIRTLPNNTPPDVVPLLAPTSVAEWRLHQSQLPPHPEALTIPQASKPTRERSIDYVRIFGSPQLRVYKLDGEFLSLAVSWDICILETLVLLALTAPYVLTIETPSNPIIAPLTRTNER